MLPGLFCAGDMPQNAAAEDVERHDFSTDYWSNCAAGTLTFNIVSSIALKVGDRTPTNPGASTLETLRYTVDTLQTTLTGNKFPLAAACVDRDGGRRCGTSRIRGNSDIEGGTLTHNGTRQHQ